jgi:hypothetical protein
MRRKVAHLIKQYADDMDKLGLAFHDKNPFRLHGKDKRQIRKYISNYNKMFVNF